MGPDIICIQGLVAITLLLLIVFVLNDFCSTPPFPPEKEKIERARWSSSWCICHLSSGEKITLSVIL